MLEVKEQLNQWLSTGFNDESVAVYGASVEFTHRILQTGQIPWHSPHPETKLLEYQKELLRNGGYLYYAYPLVERMEPFNPRLTEEIRVSLGEGLLSDLATNKILQGAKSYACGMAWLDYFHKRTGVRYELGTEVAFLAGYLFPNIFRRLERELTRGSLRYRVSDEMRPIFSNKRFTGLETSTLSVQDLRDILSECLQRRGVLIFLNSSIFQHQIIKGFEAEDEIMILSQEPMSSEVVSHLQPLSSFDRRALINFPT